MRYKRIDLAPFERGGDPLSITFVYPKDGENFVVTGPGDKVRAYVDNFAKETPCFWRYTFWHGKESRGGWQASHFFLKQQTKREKHDDWGMAMRKGSPVFEIVGYQKDGQTEVGPIYLRRIPHKWIPEFDQFLQCPSLLRPFIKRME